MKQSYFIRFVIIIFQNRMIISLNKVITFVKNRRQIYKRQHRNWFIQLIEIDEMQVMKKDDQISIASCKDVSRQGFAKELAPSCLSQNKYFHKIQQRGLLEVSLEMLHKCLVIKGISSISLSVMVVCVDEQLAALNDMKVCPT